MVRCDESLISSEHPLVRLGQLIVDAGSGLLGQLRAARIGTTLVPDRIAVSDSVWIDSCPMRTTSCGVSSDASGAPSKSWVAWVKSTASLAQHVNAGVGVRISGFGEAEHRSSRDGTGTHAEGDAPAASRANGWPIGAVIHLNSDLSWASNTLGALITRPTLGNDRPFLATARALTASLRGCVG